jgi:pantoate--beta-alanine ligase
MFIFKKSAELARFLKAQKDRGSVTGFIPTMGALHEGHLSLIREAKKSTQLVICSIFVNPTQFNDPKDFSKYPVTLENDILLLEKEATDILFLPSVEELYPAGIQGLEHYELGEIESVLEGKFRPGHFQGVCQVMYRLLKLVSPDKLFMGEKDYQQCMVVKKLLLLMHSSIELVPCPTLRETDGLAMSSRNLRLKAEERNKSNAIFNTLTWIKENLTRGDLLQVTIEATARLKEYGFKPDYVEIANANTLSHVNSWDGKEKLVALIAAFMHEVRLIDNMRMN